MYYRTLFSLLSTVIQAHGLELVVNQTVANQDSLNNLADTMVDKRLDWTHTLMAKILLNVSGRKRRYRRIIGTVDVCRTVGGRPSDGRRTVDVCGARVVSGAEKKII